MLQTAIVSLLICVSQSYDPPVITLIGDATTTINCNEPYKELGATAWSVLDGDLSDAIFVDNSAVDIANPGVYEVTYTVTDSLRQITEATRAVEVLGGLDLTLNGANEMPIELPDYEGPVYDTYWECGRPYDDPGAVASSFCDGDLTNDIKVTGADNVLPNGVGDEFFIRYEVKDSHDNLIVKFRRVTIRDGLAPVIALHGTGESQLNFVPPDKPDPAWWAIARAAFDVKYPYVINPLPVVWRILEEFAPVAEPFFWYCDQPYFTDPGASSYDDCEKVLDPGEIIVVLTQVILQPTPIHEIFIHVARMKDLEEDPMPALSPGGFYRTYYFSFDSFFNPQGSSGLPTMRSRAIQVAYGIAIQGVAGTVELQCHDLFDPRADVRAVDTCEGDISSRMVVTGSVNTSVPGIYQLRYDVKNIYETAASALRTIRVVDTERPVIDLMFEGADSSVKTVIPWCMLRDKGVDWWDEPDDGNDWYVLRPARGWTVADTCDNGDALTAQVRMQGHQELRDALEFLGAIEHQSFEGEAQLPIDPTPYLRTYTLIHNVTDTLFNQAIPAYRYVEVVPTTPKVELTVAAKTTVECGAVLGEGEGEAMLRSLVKISDLPELSGVEECKCDEATDPKFLSITGFIDTKVPGSYTVTYEATNALNISMEEPVVLQVEVVDTTAPEVIITPKPDVMITPALEWETGVPFNWADHVTVTAEDGCSGTLRPELTSDGGMIFNNPKPGLYRLVFSATDDAGNIGKATLAITIDTEFVESYPEIFLLGGSTITLECHSIFMDPGATAADEEDGDLTANIRTGGYVNTALPGTYMLAYTVINSIGNSASAARTVIVEDTAVPVISLRPPVSIKVNLNERFIDPGAIAEDNCDGSIPISVLGAVDTGKAGTYTLTYTARDSAGNDAYPLTRRVTVIDISMEGESQTGEGEGEGEPVEGEPVVKVKVPDLVLEQYENAPAILAAVNLTSGGIAYECSKEVPEGLVISQNPAAGLMVDALTPVSLVVSEGPCACGCEGQDAGVSWGGIFLGILALLVLLGVSTGVGGDLIK